MKIWNSDKDEKLVAIIIGGLIVMSAIISYSAVVITCIEVGKVCLNG